MVVNLLKSFMLEHYKNRCVSVLVFENYKYSKFGREKDFSKSFIDFVLVGLSIKTQ